MRFLSQKIKFFRTFIDKLLSLIIAHLNKKINNIKNIHRIILSKIIVTFQIMFLNFNSQ